MKLLYVPSDMDAPGSYRCLFPGRQLREAGHEVAIPPHTQYQRPNGSWGTNFDVTGLIDAEETNRFDAVILQQSKERMWATGGVQNLRGKGLATFMDVDDNYEELPTYNPSFRGTHPYRNLRTGHISNRRERRATARRIGTLKHGGHKVSNEYNRENMKQAMALVDAVTVSTPYLAEVYGRVNPNIYVVRNYLDWDIWENCELQYEVERPRLRIGYLGTFSYRQGDLNIIRGPIAKFMRKHPEIDFVATTKMVEQEDGSFVEEFPVHDFLRIPEGQRVGVPEWNFYAPGEINPLAEKTAVMDIGLVPLEDNGLNRAKSHLKGMEYNAAGIPFIASPLPSYADYYCEEGVNGILAYKEQDWLNALEMLVVDEDLRRAMGKDSRATAARNTIQANFPKWEAVYEEVLGGEYGRLARHTLTIGAVQKVSESAELFRQCAALKPKVVVEIGSAAGGTFYGLCRSAAEDALLVSIDMVGGSPIDKRNGEDVYHMRDRDRMTTYGLDNQKIRLIDGNSQDIETFSMLKAVLANAGHEEIDFLFIDGDHRYEGVKRDWELYSQLVRPGGVIAFHDIVKHVDERVGVDKFWAELVESLPDGATWEYHGRETWGINAAWAGLGFVRKSAVLVAA